MSTLTKLSAIALLLGLLGLAGCGGNGDKKANEAYANSVCTSISGWEKQVKSIATDFSNGISKQALQTQAAKVETATKSLVKEIKAIPPPNTSQGKEAKQQLDTLSTELTSTTNAVKAAAAQVQGDASAGTIAAALLTVVPQIKSLASAAKTTVSSLRDAGGSLASAFKSADACKSLT